MLSHGGNGSALFWIMNMFLLCGSETHFYLFSLFNKDLVSVLEKQIEVSPLMKLRIQDREQKLIR